MKTVGLQHNSEATTRRTRLAVAADAAGIAQAHIQAWRESFCEMLTPRALAELDLDEHTQMWAGHLKNPDLTTYVAEIHDAGLKGAEPDSEGAGPEIVGFALCGVAERGAPRSLELKMLYLVEREKGTGLGQGLFDAAVGTAPALLWVATRNPRAKAFYAKNGFAPDGTAKTIARWDNVVNERYLR